MAEARRVSLSLQIFLIFVSFSRVFSESISLGGRWTANNANKSVSLYGNVPGSVHMALFENGTIEDPYFRFNDVKYRWIAYDNWTYTRTFEVNKSIISRSKIILVCDGLDTVSTVSINDQVVGHSDNMFLRYIFDVKNAIKAGTNTIQVRFTSAIQYAKRKSQEYGYDVPPNCSVPVQRGECHRNFIRKEQSSFSWDWGPAFAPQGIWKNISVQAYDTAVIRNVKVSTQRKGSDPSSPWELDLTVTLDAAQQNVKGNIFVSIPEIPFTKTLKVDLKDAGNQNIHVGRFEFSTAQVKTWWPRGYGDQALYTTKFVFEGEDSDGSQEHSSFTTKTGFREVRLVQPLIKGAQGLGFHFEINRLPIFLKGANWIPADSFEDRVNASVLRNLLQSAADANMNVIRNWGGGIYQHDVFYSIADELGLLVWEEFMFACSMYPTNKEFLLNVKEEVVFQIERLNHHPSIFVWSGNNENEIALAENWYQTNPNKSLYVEDYIKLYVETIRTTVQAEDKTRPFIVSSPSNGLETKKEGWVSKLPNSPDWGDVHFYKYYMDCWNVSGHPNPRFASEYGFQSYPSFETLSAVSTEEDWEYNSPFMLHRQHHANGNKEMMDQIKRHFKIPSFSNKTKEFMNTLFLTQVAQAMCIKAESEHYRRLQSQLIKGQGRTMGAIYWQLNSIWQSPSWSSLEYGGKWKVLHYFAKDFFSPVISSVYEQNQSLRFFVVSDLQKPIENGVLTISVQKWSSFKIVHQRKKNFSVKPQNSLLVLSTPVTTMLKESSCPSREECFLTLTLEDESTHKTLGPINIFYLASLSKAIGLQNPKLKVTNVKQASKSEIVFDVFAKFPTPFVWLSSGALKGRFSENGFLQTRNAKTVVFYPWEEATIKLFKDSIKVTSLYDTSLY
ncbi:beta-mannosidase-like [Actinia tenebrosa]|uniref:Beta-mannosidase B n=1 Tax=Actinia tenebrosa TaxID=6105 RepID=A0A6P8IYJ6_ACTTE|nr:beta-mannosidase-like [Actinia tenebrosa]